LGAAVGDRLRVKTEHSIIVPFEITRSGSVAFENKGVLANFGIGRDGMGPAVKCSTRLIKG
jgi:hypothetical protein